MSPIGRSSKFYPFKENDEMKGGFLALAIFAGFAIVVLVYCLLAFPTIHVRYRLTVEVQDGDQIKTGTGVIDVSYGIQPDSFVDLGGRDVSTPVDGYAVTVDLGKKGLLFVTFENAERTPVQQIEFNHDVFCVIDDIGCLPFAAYGKAVQTRGMSYSQEKSALNRLRRQSGPREVPLATLPRLARFRSINDPDTFVSVSPYNLSAAFGPGVSLKRVVLQLTNDPITPLPQIWPQWLKVKGPRDGIFR